MSKGDALASGGRSAQFGPAKVSAEKWARIWQAEKKDIKKQK